jgi:hypothetical protein
VFFRGKHVRNCLSLQHPRPFFSFAQHLPASVRHLRVTCPGEDAIAAVEALKHCPGLKELDVDLTRYSSLKRSVGSCAGRLAMALSSLSLERLGLHSFTGCKSLYIPDCGIGQLDRTFHIHGKLPEFPFEDQLDEKSRCCVSKLTLYLTWTSACPSLLGCSALTELVIADCLRDFGQASSTPFSLKGLGVVAGTLRHLTVSSNSKKTSVELPEALCLHSFVCVCSGSLLLTCNPQALGQGLVDVLLGYASIAGTGAKVVENLAPRLGTAVLEVLRPQTVMRQSVMFSRPGLVGEWWYRVFQPSKQQQDAGWFCSRLRVWAQGKLCPPYLTFLRYGIVSAHEHREVLYGIMDEWREEKFVKCMRPGWHSRRHDMMAAYFYVLAQCNNV